MTNAKSRGFTLIEMAIILVILGLLAGLTFPLFSGLTKQRHYRSTQKELEEIKEALVGYAGIYWRLPYADTTGDGVGDSGQANGNLPYMDLGLGAVDSWRNSYHYDVNSRLITTTTQSAFCTALSSIATGENPQLAFSSGGTPASQAAVVISMGENSALDGENGDADQIYESIAPTDSFNDLVIALNPNTLFGKLNCAGSGGSTTCTSYAVVNQRTNTVSVLGGNYSSCTQIPGSESGSFIILSGQTVAIYNNSNCTGGSPSQVTFNDAGTADSNGNCIVGWTQSGLQDK